VVQVSQPLRVQLGNHQRQTQNIVQKNYIISSHRHRYVKFFHADVLQVLPSSSFISAPLDNASAQTV
jgi:hypothetical protein